MTKSIFRKFHGVPDKDLLGALTRQAMQAELLKRVTNHNARILIEIVVLTLVEAAAMVYVLVWRLK